ncbi:unnamed protein product [Closterium sp. Yama58-4]|nr:unnamed protein product [Closterium sp. Yama58-4]
MMRVLCVFLAVACVATVSASSPIARRPPKDAPACAACDNGTLCVPLFSFCFSSSGPSCKDGSDFGAPCADYQPRSLPLSPHPTAVRACPQCPAGSSKCADEQQCVLDSARCDGTKDCRDGSDEDPKACAAFDCSSIGMVRNASAGRRYGDGRRVLYGHGGHCCDKYHCYSRSFHTLPPFTRSFPAISTGTLLTSLTASSPRHLPRPPRGRSGQQCPSGTGCMFLGQACDGVSDCSDGSDEDEAFCKTFNCSDAGKSTCPSGVGCIFPDAMCNGRADCTDGSDEAATTCNDSFDCSATGRVACPLKGGCVWEYQLCDGMPDCRDGSDELPQFCSKFNCSNSYRTQCPGGQQCTYEGLLCDGRKDCSDGSDEGALFCSSYNCSDTDRVVCPTVDGSAPACVSASLLCDGTPHCPGDSDEDRGFCADHECAPGLIKCPGSLLCVPGTLCNGFPDCRMPTALNTAPDSDPVAGPDAVPPLKPAVMPRTTAPTATPGTDGTTAGVGGVMQGGAAVMMLEGVAADDGGVSADEDPAMCAAYKCPEGWRKCADGLQCVSEDAWCSGVKECHDGTDEDEETCTGYDCAATGRVPCPGGKYCLWNYCDVCNDERQPLCPDASDQAESACHLKQQCPVRYYKDAPLPRPLPLPQQDGAVQVEPDSEGADGADGGDGDANGGNGAGEGGGKAGGSHPKKYAKVKTGTGTSAADGTAAASQSAKGVEGGRRPGHHAAGVGHHKSKGQHNKTQSSADAGSGSEEAKAGSGKKGAIGTEEATGKGSGSGKPGKEGGASSSPKKPGKGASPTTGASRGSKVNGTKAGKGGVESNGTTGGKGGKGDKNAGDSSSNGTTSSGKSSSKDIKSNGDSSKGSSGESKKGKSSTGDQVKTDSSKAKGSSGSGTTGTSEAKAKGKAEGGKGSSAGKVASSGSMQAEDKCSKGSQKGKAS